jgi:hypothetical protein
MLLNIVIMTRRFKERYSVKIENPSRQTLRLTGLLLEIWAAL